jgi:hypothetical protein
MDATRCGIANFAEQCSTALRRAGAEVTDWNANYSSIYARREAGQPTYLPDDAADYDVILLGWHPIALNTYGADHFPAGPLLAVYLHDLPPWSACPFEDRIDYVMTSEAYAKSACVLPYPVPDWVTGLPDPADIFTVGLTGVRGDGHAEVREVCARYGWAVNASGETWLSLEDEVRRLARSTINVCWYHEGRGIAGAPSMCLASRRPLLVNTSPMLRHLHGHFSQVISVIPDSTGSPEACLRAVAQGAYGRHYLTRESPEDATLRLGWGGAATYLLEQWAERRAERRSA